MRRSIVHCILCAVLPAAPLAAQRDFDAVEIKTHPVAGRVYMLEGAGGNIGVSAGEDGLLIVDDQFAPLAAKIKVALRDIDRGQLEFVLNTHWHGDHTGGNPVFGLEALIVAHRNVRERLATEQQSMGRTIQPSPPEALPVITFEEGLSIHFNGEEIRVIHVPQGHTDGDSLVHFTKSNVLHMGDDFFAGRFPFVDLAAGGTVQGMAQAVAKVLREFPNDVKIIPGHGPLSTVDDLRLYHRMLIESMDTIRNGIEAGSSLEEIQATGLPEKWEGWGSGFITQDVWIRTVFESLSR